MDAPRFENRAIICLALLATIALGTPAPARKLRCPASPPSRGRLLRHANLDRYSPNRSWSRDPRPISLPSMSAGTTTLRKDTISPIARMTPSTWWIPLQIHSWALSARATSRAPGSALAPGMRATALDRMASSPMISAMCGLETGKAT